MPFSLWQVPAALVAAGVLCISPRSAGAQEASRPTSADSTPPPQPSRRAWYERLSLRGYTQVRYNRLLETNPDLVCAQCDRSIGRNGGFFIRRARLVVSGDVSDRLSVYIQPDLATEAAGSLHFAQLRDAYFDVFLDAGKTFRVRVGQSKIPFGWENLQSSSNRLPLDRADPLNSAMPNERDLGVFAYWSPTEARKRFRILTDSGLKGTGDYGVVGVGTFNGQTANRPEANNGQHVVARVTYPFRFAGGQFVEVGVQGYDGRVVVPSSQRTAGVAGGPNFDDRRAAATLVIYPQPVGFQAEWNTGTGPEIDLASQTIANRRLEGGYAQTMLRTRFRHQFLTPFIRAQYYRGGKKQETDARRYRMREYEVGVEWLPFAAVELTAMYTISDRRFEDAAMPDNRQRGQLLRLQAQFNY